MEPNIKKKNTENLRKKTPQNRQPKDADKTDRLQVVAAIPVAVAEETPAVEEIGINRSLMGLR